METTTLSASLRLIISQLHKGLRKQMYSVNLYSMTEIDTIRHLIRCTSLLPTELATLTRIKTQSMTPILKKLEQQGIIKKEYSKEDKRKINILITPYGRKMVEQTKYDREEWLKNRIENALSNKEIEVLEQAIPVLQKLIELK